MHICMYVHINDVRIKTTERMEFFVFVRYRICGMSFRERRDSVRIDQCSRAMTLRNENSPRLRRCAHGGERSR